MQVKMDVPTTRSANRVQGSNEMSRNPHNTTEQNVEESMFNHFGQRVVDHRMPINSNVVKRFDIERLKALRAIIETDGQSERNI